jgi:hypothetical protein
MVDQQRSAANNVPVTGKIGKAAPTATIGAGTAPLTGPLEDDRMTPTSMHDPLPLDDYEPSPDVGETED